MFLFTSIKPPKSDDETAYLRMCLDSWIASGFHPVAVNGPSEIKRLRSLGLPLEFSPLAVDGKPRIGAILEAVRTSGARFAGIINSDCRMIAYPGNIANRLAEGLSGRAVLVWRLDVGGAVEAVAEPDGIDAFFFDTAHVPSSDGGFSIGDVFWDNWFPIALAAAGARINRLDLPFLTHRRHPAAWNQSDWYAGAQRGWTAFLAIRDDMPDIGVPAAWWNLESLTEAQLGPMGFHVCEWIRRQPSCVAFLDPSMADLEATLSAVGRSLIGATLQGYVWRERQLQFDAMRAELERRHNSFRNRLHLRKRWESLRLAISSALSSPQ